MSSSPEDQEGVSNLVTQFAEAADDDEEEEDKEEEEGEEEEQPSPNAVSSPLPLQDFTSDKETSEQCDLHIAIQDCPALQVNHRSAARSKSALKHLRFFMPTFYRYKGESKNMVDIEDLVCQGRDNTPMIVGQTHTKTGTDPDNKATYNPNDRSTQWHNEMIIHFSGYLVKAHKWLKVNYQEF